MKKSIPNTFQDLLGTSIGMAGSFYCELLMVWHETHEWTYFAICLLMPDQNMLVCALSNILFTSRYDHYEELLNSFVLIL